MKTFTAALIAATMLTAPAYAWDYNQAGHNNQQIGDNASGVQNNTSQRQGQAQGQSQTARSASSATSNSKAAGGKGGKGGSSNVAVTNSVGSGGNNVGGGLGLTVPGGYGNAPCGGGVGLGGLGLSGGGSGGGTLWEFADCKRMRESSALLQLGYPDAALAELCQIDRVREAFGGRCPGEPGAVMVQMPAPEPPMPEPMPARVAFCDLHTSVIWQDGSCHHRLKPKPVVTLQPMTCHDLIVETLRECREERHDAR